MNPDRRKRDLRICLLIFPLKHPVNECGQTFLTQYLNIIAPLVSTVTVITGNYIPRNIPGNVQIINVYAPVVETKREPVFSQLFRLFLGQCTLGFELMRMRSRVDIVNLYMWTGAVSLPVLLARLLNKEIWLTSTGSSYYSAKKMYSSACIPRIIWLIERSNYHLANRILLLGGDAMIREYHLESLRSRVCTRFYSFFIDTGKFFVQTGLSRRNNVIGYIGRLSPEKGVMQFVRAIPLLLAERSDLRFLIVSDGPLMADITRYLAEMGCADSVTLTGWVDEKEIPVYLNDLRLLILPSYTEGLANIILEAMACGTPVLSTAVGAIPDVVKEGVTGYLLGDNSPETITRKTLEILADPRLEEVHKNARSFIENNFDYNHVQGRWKNLFDAVSADDS